ncbi:MAG: nucleotidyltransferase family protein [Butyrivibrio sp.]|nr:nucleotidyltransferase family protein [Butyrivibrio sp.]
MKLEQFTIDANAALLDVMKKIDENAKGIVYVVDAEGVLKGTITDGDVRRYILRNVNMSCTASEVMHTGYKFIAKEEAYRAKTFMQANRITSVPIVDADGRLDSIEFADGERYYKSAGLDVPVVIMAGGKGTRLYPYTQILPKPLIPVGEKTITEHIFEHFEEFGCNNFSMIVNYKRDFIKAYFTESRRQITYYDEDEFRGTAGGLRLLKGHINETFFMTNCDILIEDNYFEILKYHRQRGNIITLVCALKKETIPYGIIETRENGEIIRLKEKPSFDFLTNTGFYVIEPEFLDEIPDTFIHITDVIQSCIDKGLKVGVYPVIADSWMDMGQLEELDKMRQRMESR